MTIERNRFVRLAANVLGKKRVYEIHDRLMDRKFENIFYKRAELNDALDENLGGLWEHGITRTNLQRLGFERTEIEGLWNEYGAWADKLTGSNDQTKFYEHKMNPKRHTILDPESWLYRIGTDERLSKVARAYFGGKACTLFYADFWHTVPMTGERIASQRWHRDSEDSRLLKVFIYLNEISERNGCFEFVKKTSRGLEYENLTPKFRVSKSVGASKATSDFISINHDLIFRGVGQRNDVIMCDTTGFHRGGFLEEGCRKLVNFVYTSRRCPHVFYSLRNQNGQIERIDL